MIAESTPIFYAIALVVFPLVMGAVFGGLARARLSLGEWQGRLWLTGVALALVPLSFVSGVVVQQVGFWDLGATSFLFAAGLIVLLWSSSDRVGASRLLLAISSVGLSLLVVEALLVGLLQLHPAPVGSVVGFASLRSEHWDPGCAAAYSTGRESFGWSDPLKQDGSQASVVHLGDSMVFGTGAGGPSAAFPSWFDRWDSDRRHINAGYWGTSADTQWLAARRWLTTQAPDVVVHYVFIGNDIHEMDRPSVCCGMQPLLVYGDEPSPRCESAIWKVPVRERLVSGPAPYFVRVFAQRSAAAVQLASGFARLGSWLGSAGVFGEWYGRLKNAREEGFLHFSIVERALRKDVELAGSEIIVVLLASRQVTATALGRDPVAIDMWEGSGVAAHDRVRADLREGGFELIDTVEFFEELVEDPHRAKWFARDVPGDFHLSPEGHERFAEWLWPRLLEHLN